MTVERVVRPAGPYSLVLCTRHSTDATRSVRDGVLGTTLLVDGGRVEVGRGFQRHDGAVVLQAASEAGLGRLRFVLALDDDHSDFLRSVGDDPLLGRSSRLLRGLRPVRVPTVAHALLRAFCGQLIESRRARSLERTIVRRLCAAGPERLHVAPTTRDLAALAPSQLRALGLHARRAAAIVRLCRSLDLERLHAQPTDVVARRLERERGLGPWSIGVVCLEGLGRMDYGLVGDLGLIKLLRALRGRPVEGWETAELLEPYGEWAGLASVYLLAGFSRGLLPVGEARAA